jgi:hypothetical protein
MMSARQNAVLRRFNQSLNNWNVINVRNMNRMFKDARSFNQPLNNWDMSNVDYMNHMFEDAGSFNQPLDNCALRRPTRATNGGTASAPRSRGEERSIGSRGRPRLRLWRSVLEMGAIAKTVTWTASCLSYSRRRWVRGRRRNASMSFLACIARPRLTPSLVLMGRRRTTLDLDAISDLVVRPGVREGLAKASWGRSTRRDVLGK